MTPKQRKIKETTYRMRHMSQKDAEAELIDFIDSQITGIDHVNELAAKVIEQAEEIARLKGKTMDNCAECGILTNHTTDQHELAARVMCQGCGMVAVKDEDRLCSECVSERASYYVPDKDEDGRKEAPTEGRENEHDEGGET